VEALAAGSGAIGLSVDPLGNGQWVDIDSATFTGVLVDLDTDSDNDGTINPDNSATGDDDPIETNDPGRILALNDDDDNNNGTADKLDPGAVTGENDLAALITRGLGIQNWADYGTLTVEYNDSIIALYHGNDRSAPIASSSPLSPSSTIYAEGIAIGSTLVTWSYVSANISVTDSILISVADFDLSVDRHHAYREPAMSFEASVVPEEIEEEVGAGLFRNGDDDNGSSVADNLEFGTVTGEDDLVRLFVKTVPGDMAGLKYTLLRSNEFVQVWRRDTKLEALFDSVERPLEVELAGGGTFWLEWSTMDLSAIESFVTLRVTIAETGIQISEDVIRAYPFNSVIVGLSGESASSGGGSSIGNGSLHEYANQLNLGGYNVIYYDEDNVNDGIGSGAVFDEIARQRQEHGIQDVGIFGYSHGGGKTYWLSHYMNAQDLDVNLRMTAYIDAIRTNQSTDSSPETRLPIGTAYHVNIYQTNGTVLTGYLVGETTADEEYDVTDMIDHLNDHYSIEDEPFVRTVVINRLKDKLDTP